MRELRQNLTSYAIAAAVAIVALLFRKLLVPVMGNENPYHTVWLAVMFSAFYCGIGPAVITTVISSVGILYWFLPPYYSFTGHSNEQLFGAAGFLIFSVVIIVLGEST